MENTKSVKKQNIYDLTTIALMTAIMCILGPLSIPIGLVPISLTSLVIYFMVYILGWKKATLSCIVYLLIGLIGIPVFSSYTAGVAKLFGPTGGYLIGFIFMAIISGIFVEKFPKKQYMCLLGMILGTIVMYTLGTFWLKFQGNMTFKAALLAGVVPFIIGDLAKMIVSSIIGPIIRTSLITAGFIKK